MFGVVGGGGGGSGRLSCLLDWITKKVIRPGCAHLSPALLLAFTLAPKLSSSSQLRGGKGASKVILRVSGGAWWGGGRYELAAVEHHGSKATRPETSRERQRLTEKQGIRRQWQHGALNSAATATHTAAPPPHAAAAAGSPLHPAFVAAEVKGRVAGGLHLVHVVPLLHRLQNGCKGSRRRARRRATVTGGMLAAAPGLAVPLPTLLLLFAAMHTQQIHI